MNSCACLSYFSLTVSKKCTIFTCGPFLTRNQFSRHISSTPAIQTTPCLESQSCCRKSTKFSNQRFSSSRSKKVTSNSRISKVYSSASTNTDSDLSLFILRYFQHNSTKEQSTLSCSLNNILAHSAIDGT